MQRRLKLVPFWAVPYYSLTGAVTTLAANNTCTVFPAHKEAMDD